jgi:hypothetical protein
MKRDLIDTAKDYKIEKFLFRFLNKQIPAVLKQREQLLEKTLKEFAEIHQDVFEKQILRIFDFTAWVESILRKVPLAEVLQIKLSAHNTSINQS